MQLNYLGFSRRKAGEVEEDLSLTSQLLLRVFRPSQTVGSTFYSCSTTLFHKAWPCCCFLPLHTHPKNRNKSPCRNFRASFCLFFANVSAAAHMFSTCLLIGEATEPWRAPPTPEGSGMPPCCGWQIGEWRRSHWRNQIWCRSLSPSLPPLSCKTLCSWTGVRALHYDFPSIKILH